MDKYLYVKTGQIFEIFKSDKKWATNRDIYFCGLSDHNMNYIIITKRVYGIHFVDVEVNCYESGILLHDLRIK